MTAGDQLDALRAGFAGITVMIFVDLSAGMVLAASASQKIAQEHLDVLCQSAIESLNGSNAQTVAQTLAGAGASTQSSITVCPDCVEVFIRSPLEPAEALCLRCKDTRNLGDLIAHSKALLTEIGQEAR